MEREKIIDDIIVKLQILEKEYIWLPTSDFLESFEDLARVSGVELPPEKIKELGQKVKAQNSEDTTKMFSSFKIPSSAKKDSKKDVAGLLSSFKISSTAQKDLIVGIRYIKLAGKLSELSYEDLQCLWKELSEYRTGTGAYQSFCKTLVILHGPNFIIR